MTPPALSQAPNPKSQTPGLSPFILIMKTAFVCSPDYSQFHYGDHHPLKIYRLRLTYELIKAYGGLDWPSVKVITAPYASLEELELFHQPDYLQVLEAADRGEEGRWFYSHGLGPGDNPVFPGMYRWSQLVAGGSLEAARQVLSGEGEIAFHMGGGLHHALPSRAAGFCYVNDAAVAIAYLVKQGKRVAYIDIDAHHGDGVQWAFYSNNRVLTLSFHETGAMLFPGTGFQEELGEGEGLGFSANVPLPPLCHDEAFIWAFKEVAPPLIKAFRPDIIVTQLGVDSFVDDPLTHLQFTLGGFLAAVQEMKSWGLPWVALGGGGYKVSNVARAWAGAWGVMNGMTLPESPPEVFWERIGHYGSEFQKAGDPYNGPSAKIQDQVIEETKRSVARLKQLIFPYHGL